MPDNAPDRRFAIGILNKVFFRELDAELANGVRHFFNGLDIGSLDPRDPVELTLIMLPYRIMVEAEFYDSGARVQRGSPPASEQKEIAHSLAADIYIFLEKFFAGDSEYKIPDR